MSRLVKSQFYPRPSIVTPSNMKLKAFYIALTSLIFVTSLFCIVVELIKTYKTNNNGRKTRESSWEDLISTIENDERLEQQEFHSIDLFDLKLKKVRIVGRIKAADDLKLQNDDLDMQQKRELYKIIGKQHEKLGGMAMKTSEAESEWMNLKKPFRENEMRYSYQTHRLGKGRFIEEAKPNNISMKRRHIKKTRKKVFEPGFLNLYIWDNICDYTIESLRGFILFPSLPKFQEVINKTEIQNISLKNSGVRVFGFLKPEQTGLYRFGISSRGNSELWLSNDTVSLTKKKVAFVGYENNRGLTKQGVYDELSTQISQKLHMTGGMKYFIEILYKHTTGAGRLEVAWITPNSSTFEVIPGRFLSASIDGSNVTDSKAEKEEYEGVKVQMSTKNLNSMMFMEFVDFKKAFPYCEYDPSYYITKKLVRFQGARNKSNTHFAEIYPPDSSNETLPLVNQDNIWWTENNYGNDVIDNATAMLVGKMFTEALETTYKDDFKVVKMMSLERVVDKAKGSRYHVQMEVKDIYSGRFYEFSEFLYQPKGVGSLCFPRDFRWNKYADINIIVPVKDSGRWLLYFIKNLAEIIIKTLDPHIHLIIVDYDSTDIDIEAVLKRAIIVRHTVVRMSGDKAFNRAEALQRGADVVMDPHSILFMCDLHLTMPSTFIETIRKHCVEGKMAFAPVVKRLRCGSYPNKPFGYWETLGFGLFALYKSDFDRIGAMNVQEFKKWGGEDWELLDRVLESQMEVERLKIPSFYHFFHPAYGSEYSRINA